MSSQVVECSQEPLRVWRDGVGGSGGWGEEPWVGGLCSLNGCLQACCGPSVPARWPPGGLLCPTPFLGGVPSASLSVSGWQFARTLKPP